MSNPSEPRVEAPGDGDRALDELVAECVMAFQSGGRPAFESVVARHPAHADELRTRMRRLEKLGVLTPPTEPGAMPDRIGPYRILAELGRGGMGTVYRAEQTEPVSRKVALKVIKLGLDTRETLARFDLERRTLALMEHPNIARVFDAGSTADGRPYFVMELVSGVPVTDYCDEHRLTVTERLEHFVEICAAVQHAHQKGVIHRDLKPSNILVGSRDGDTAELKIIDFGIAKAIDHHVDGLTLQAMRTLPGQLIGTPEYMSPEQATSGKAEVDTRSDVYSLGVVLYELLTGVLPFATEHLWNQDLAGMQRILATELPAKASTRIAQAPTEQIAGRRGSNPTELRRTLRGDLDRVLQKALAKERDRRYQSPSEFAQDIERYLRHEPVSATPPSGLYRLRKLVQRNRGRVAAAAALLLTIVIGFVTSTVLYFDVREAHGRELDARTTAEDRAKEAEEVARFLEDLFQFASPTHPDRGAMPVRDVFAQGVARVRQQFPDRPLVRARLLARIGRVYYWLGLHPSAIDLLDEAIGLRRPRVAADDTEIRGWELDRAMALQGVGKFEDAKAIYTACLARTAHSADDRLAHGQALSLLGNVLHEQGQTAEAETKMRAAVDLLRGADTDNEGMLATALNHFAGLLHDTDRNELALPLFEEALRLRWLRNPEGHPVIPRIQQNMVRCLMALQRFEKAEAVVLEALSSAERILGAEHPDIALVLVTHALLLRRMGRNSEVEAKLRRALEIREAVLAPNHPDRAWSLNDLACLLIDSGRHDEATPLLQRAVVAYRAVHGRDHLHTAIALLNLAISLANIGRLDEAEKAARESIAMCDRLETPLSAHRASAWNALAEVHIQQKRLKDAEAAIVKAIELWSRAPNSEWDRGWGHVRLAFCRNLSGESSAAENAARDGLRLLRSASDIDHDYIANALFQIGWSLHGQKQGAAALPLYRESLAMYGRVAPEGNATVTYVLERYGVLLQKSDPDAAIETIRKCYELRRRFLGAENQLTGQTKAYLDRLVAKRKKGRDDG